MYNTTLQSNSPVFQFFLDYLSSHMDNMLLVCLRDPSKITEALRTCFQEPITTLTFDETPVQKAEIRSYQVRQATGREIVLAHFHSLNLIVCVQDLAPWDSRLFLVPRYDALIKQLEDLIAQSPKRIDRHLMRIFYYVQQPGKSKQTLASIRDLSKLEPTHPIIDCKDLFMKMFAELTPSDMDKISNDTDKIGDWARVYVLKEKTRTQQRVVTAELSALFKEVAMRDDNATPDFVESVRKALTSLNVVKEGTLDPVVIHTQNYTDWVMLIPGVCWHFGCRNDHSYDGSSGGKAQDVLRADPSRCQS
jgi:hypothetical protein